MYKDYANGAQVTARLEGIQQADDPRATVNAQLLEASSLEFEEAGAYLKAAAEAVTMARALETPGPLLFRALCVLGNARRVNGEFAGAIEVLDEALQGAAELPDNDERDAILGDAHLYMAIVHDVVDAIIAGFEHLDCANDHFTRLGDEASLARCGLVRGALHLRIDDFEQAEDQYRRSLDYYVRTGQSDRIGSTWSNLSVVLRFMGRHEEAVAAGREALKAATSLLLRTTSTGNLAFALGAAGQLDEAMTMARKAALMLSELGDPNYTIEYKRALAWILIRQGENKEALELLTEALAVAREKGYHRDVTACHGLLAGIHRDMGDFRNAYLHLEKYHEQTLAQSRKKAASQLEVHKWRLEVESARFQADQERQRRQHLAESYAELTEMHERLTARAVELEWSSYRDALTELANRRYFDERLAREAERSLESGTGISLMMIDLDEFKSINDSFGHPVGDEVLRETARILQAGTRRSDMCARIGGEEFAILLTTEVEPYDLQHLANQLRHTFVDHNWASIAQGLNVSISIGAASLSEVDHDPILLLRMADQRLYAAKRAGRNQVVAGLPKKRQRR